MLLTTINWNGGIIFPNGDTANWGADAQSCFFSRPQTIAFNRTPASPQAISVTGAAGSNGDPNNDGNRRATGVVAGVVFGH